MREAATSRATGGVGMESRALTSRQLGPVIAGVLFNLIPIVGALFWGWSVFTLVFLYWIENVAVGARTLASMAGSAFYMSSGKRYGILFFGPFFTLHYGVFCIVHGAFVVALFGTHLRDAGVEFEPFAIVRATMREHPDFGYALLSIGLWQLVQLALFFVRGQARTADFSELMGAPYPRIMLLHITILAGGALVLALGQPIWGLALMAVLKALFDVGEAAPIASPAPPR
jgi:Family of unknown function (DUF6498)